MDQRVQELKALKKYCGRCRRKRVALPGTFCLIFLVLGLAVAPLAMELPVYPPEVTAFLAAYSIVEPIWFIGAAGLCGLLFLLFAILWARGKRRFKKSQEYLNWRTLRTTLRAEKQTIG